MILVRRSNKHMVALNVAQHNLLGNDLLLNFTWKTFPLKLWYFFGVYKKFSLFNHLRWSNIFFFAASSSLSLLFWRWIFMLCCFYLWIMCTIRKQFANWDEKCLKIKSKQKFYERTVRKRKKNNDDDQENSIRELFCASFSLSVCIVATYINITRLSLFS